MVTSKIEIVNVAKRGEEKRYTVFYVSRENIPMTVNIKGHLFFPTILDAKKAIKQVGGSNLIKRNILVGKVPLRQGVLFV